MVSPLPVEPPQTVAPFGAPDRRAGMSVRMPCVYVWIYVLHHAVTGAVIRAAAMNDKDLL